MSLLSEIVDCYSTSELQQGIIYPVARPAFSTLHPSSKCKNRVTVQTYKQYSSASAPLVPRSTSLQHFQAPNMNQTLWPEVSAGRLVLRATEGLVSAAGNLTITLEPFTKVLQLVDVTKNHSVPHVIDVIALSDVIGAKAERIEASNTFLLEIYVYPRQRMSKAGIFGRWCFPSSSSANNTTTLKTNANSDHLGYRFACHRSFVVTAAASTEEHSTVDSEIHFQDDVSNVIHAIQILAHHSSSSSSPSTTDDMNENKNSDAASPGQYLIMINPFSGTKKALSIYESSVKPMFIQAGIQHDTFITEYAGHAFQRIQGGKGDRVVIHESSHRDISQYEGIILMGGDGILFEVLQALQSRSDWTLLTHRLKFGIIGCGTCNGLAASLLHARKEKYSQLESTFIICKGHTDKLDLSMYHTVAKSYVAFLTFSWAIIADIDIESEKLRFLGILRNDVWAAWRVLHLRTYKAKFSYLDCKDVQLGLSTNVLPSSLTEDVPPEWKTMEADFVLFWASHVSHAAYNVIQSPQSTLRDGIFRIMIVRAPCSRLEAANILLALESGEHVTSPKVEFIECVAYRLEPLTMGSFNVLDGEVIESGPIQASIMPSEINFFQ